MEIRQHNGVAIIATGEKLDAVTSPQLRNAVTRALEGGTVRLIVDLSGTVLIDSSGCGALVASLQDLLREKGDMRLAAPNQQAKTLFQLTGLDRVFKIFDTVEMALESFSSLCDGSD